MKIDNIYVSWLCEERELENHGILYEMGIFLKKMTSFTFFVVLNSKSRQGKIHCFISQPGWMG
jgi:hypothetical protein